jgi:hypothetical protein
VWQATLLRHGHVVAQGQTVTCCKCSPFVPHSQHVTVWPWATVWPGLSSTANHTMKIFQYCPFLFEFPLCVCVCIYIYMRPTHMYVHTHAHTHVCVYVCVHICKPSVRSMNKLIQKNTYHMFGVNMLVSLIYSSLFCMVVTCQLFVDGFIKDTKNIESRLRPLVQEWHQTELYQEGFLHYIRDGRHFSNNSDTHGERYVSVLFFTIRVGESIL